jgi:hypothetical protein
MNLGCHAYQELHLRSFDFAQAGSELVIFRASASQIA